MGRGGESTARSRCFLQLVVDGQPLGRLVVECRDDVVPITVNNFKGLCAGLYEAGYKGTTLHRIIPQFMAQVGCILDATGVATTLTPILSFCLSSVMAQKITNHIICASVPVDKAGG